MNRDDEETQGHRFEVFAAPPEWSRSDTFGKWSSPRVDTLMDGQGNAIGTHDAVQQGSNSGAASPIVVANSVVKIYGTATVTVRALDDVSLAINPGEVVAIMGPSGSGKTTLLNCLAGLDTIDDGQIIVAGQDLATLNERALTAFRASHMGFIFQNFNLLPMLTAVENVELPLLIATCAPQEARSRAQQALAEVGLEHRGEHVPAELSGGQRQRVAIARALIHQPAILWADEPTGSLDSDAATEIMELLRRMNQAHDQTIVIVTHATDIAARADRIVHMRDGTIAK